jgi:diguanylate cyclase (GGDEF)-like protein/PAS domain S-box-containing protein
MRWSTKRLHNWIKRRAAGHPTGRGKPRLDLNAAVNNLSQGLAIFGPDQRLVICNRSYAEIYRLSAELSQPETLLRDILEHRAAQGIYSGNDPQAYVRRVLDRTAGARASTEEFSFPDGRIIFVTHRPMPDGGWVSTHEDATVRRRQEEASQRKLHEQNMHLDAALENMSHGLAMFDRHGKLIVCNRQYGEMYGIPIEQLPPGISLEEVLRLRIARGSYAGNDPQQYMNRILAMAAANKPGFNEFTLPNGRVLSVAHRPMPDGGWVATLEDITERKRAEVELNRTKMFLDTVIENVPVAILVREPETFRYVLINRAAEQFVGSSRDQVLGKTAYDIFPKERADLIAEHDAAALKTANVPLLITDHSIQIPGGRDRNVTTKKLTVRASNGMPQCLIAVIEDVTEKRLAEEQIAFLAHHDALTGLPNRAQFSKRLAEELERVGRGAQLAVLFLDLDHFKTVNDTLGHFVGDELLKAVADRLRQCIRNVDVIGRLGGDEFAIVLIALEQPADASILAVRVQDAIKAPYDLAGVQAVVDVSIGIALAPNDAVDAAELMKRADMALYQAKSEGRSRYRFFEPSMDAAMKARRKLDTELRGALARGEFELFYQPVVDLAGNDIVGMEALLRWHHPMSGMIAPAEFIPVAEESGLIIPIGEWVIRQACADAARWPGTIRTALNLSPVQFRSPTLMQTIINALSASGLAPSRLELEITEDVLLRHSPENLAVLEQLRNLGVRIVMDDFGTGYSSLNYLRRFPFDKVKIDRSFITDLEQGKEESRAIVQAVVRLATALNVSTTAEGVETQEQLELVRTAGCTEYQGYLFSAPKPLREIVRLFPPRRRASVA